MCATVFVTKPISGKVMISICIPCSTFKEWFTWTRALGHLPQTSIRGYSGGRRVSVAPFPKGIRTVRWILDGWIKSSDNLHLMFLLEITISCHCVRFPSKWSYPKPQKHLLPCFLLALSPTWATLAGSSKESGTQHTSGLGSPAREECRLLRRLKALGKCSPAVSCQHSSPSAFPKVSGRKSFFVLISSNKNNEFLKPTRMWQGANKANQKGDVWSIGCSSNKSLHKPVLQGGNSNSLEPLFLVFPFRFSPAKYPK